MPIPSSYYLPELPQSLAGLAELSLDLRWSWDHTADALWEQIDPSLWAQTHNPWLILQNLGKKQIAALTRKQSFRKILDTTLQKHQGYLTHPAWFAQTYPQPPFVRVAYFSMEYGLSEALPIYSGGLGMLAGDCLKTASDLGVPLVGIGILWQQGYFRQHLNPQGEQLAQYPYNDPVQMPVIPLRDKNDEWVRIAVPFPGRKVILRVWQAQIGRVLLYLLDSNDPVNDPADRSITAELYGGGPETRLQQEICLGLGGWKLLEELQLSPDICHLNEGHAALVTIARAQSYLQKNQCDFFTAWDATRAGNIFTTHTPVAAGFDRFAAELFTHYLSGMSEELPESAQNLLALGRTNPSDPSEPFNMAWLAIRGSMVVNAVSALHGMVSRRLFQPLFPHWPEAEVPVTYVTNGVHMSSWDSEKADELWEKHSGKTRWLTDTSSLADDLQHASDQEIWELRNDNRQKLIAFARQRLLMQRSRQACSPAHREEANSVLDPDLLTLGFARRFTDYKRTNLLLTDTNRLYQLLSHPHFPVQLVIAGKAHPQDEPGQRMIQQWIQFIHQHPDLNQRIVFLEDYDMLIAEHMVQGVDLWINTPRRPWEASGTSGMKVLVNGGLNLSELDGWWAEAFGETVGWAIGDRQEHGNDPAWDQMEASKIYQLLEEQIVPLFYQNRDTHGCPCKWIRMIRNSMAILTPRFSCNRMVREYVEKLYVPATKMLANRNTQQQLASIRTWKEQLQLHWNHLRFGELAITEEQNETICSVPVYLDDLDPSFIAVELYADGINDQEASITAMIQGEELVASPHTYIYTCALPKPHRNISEYTPRVIPKNLACFVPLEAQNILWYR